MLFRHYMVKISNINALLIFIRFLYIRAEMGSRCPPRHGKDVFDVQLFSIFWRRPSLCLLEHISQLQYLGALIYGFWKHDNTHPIKRCFLEVLWIYIFIKHLCIFKVYKYLKIQHCIHLQLSLYKIKMHIGCMDVMASTFYYICAVNIFFLYGG